MNPTWADEISESQSSCSRSRRKFGLHDCGVSVGGVAGLETTGAGSGTGAIGTVVTGSGAGSIDWTATTGASICLCQYVTAIPRCQKRGISKRKSVICAITKAPATLSAGTNFIHIQSPPTNRMAATTVTTT